MYIGNKVADLRESSWARAVAQVPLAAAIELEEWFSKYVALLKRFAFIGASFDGFLALNCFDL